MSETVVLATFPTLRTSDWRWVARAGIGKPATRIETVSWPCTEFKQGAPIMARLASPEGITKSTRVPLDMVTIEGEASA